MQWIELAAILVAPSDSLNCPWGRFGHPKTLQGGEQVLSWLPRSRARPHNRSTAFLQWMMAACPPTQQICTVARGIANMQSIGLAAIYGAPSGNLGLENNFFRTTSQLKSFVATVCAVIGVATGHCKYAANRAGDPLRGTL
ncbi:hypothetical protein N9L68_01445 [bacterium]|nr:hypothetical protein [bacterium]